MDVVIVLLSSDEITFYRVQFSHQYLLSVFLGQQPESINIRQWPKHGLSKTPFGSFGLRLYEPKERALALQYLARIHGHCERIFKELLKL